MARSSLNSKQRSKNDLEKPPPKLKVDLSNIKSSNGVPNSKSVKVTDPGLLTRTSYTNASVALDHIKKGRARGNKPALWVRSKLQEELFQLGVLIQAHAGKILFTGLLLLCSMTIGLKSVVTEQRLEKLWVAEGGRLDREMDYIDKTLGAGSGGVNQMFIQTAEGDGKMLTSDALLNHLEVLLKATRVTVSRDDITWQLQDLCYKPSIPQNTEIPIVDQILDKLFPCAIITPLDCFWEGSRLLGPDFPVHVPLGGDKGSKGITWQSLHPTKLFQEMAEAFPSVGLDQFQHLMKEAGISSGYQEKPCLNPQDPECPRTAPNKGAAEEPDIGVELTGGCSSFATRYMRWPEELVVGGVEKNKTGMISDARALQSVIQLMGPRDMLEYWSNTYKVHTLRWNIETAEEILNEFQLKFQAEVEKARSVQDKFTFNSYSSLALEHLMQNFSTMDMHSLVIGYLVMMAYAGITLYNWTDKVRSHAGLGIAGVILVGVSIAAGLGIAALAGITFNASTTQIVPFLSLGLGVDAVFLLVHTFTLQTPTNIPAKDQVGEVMRKSGISVILTHMCNIAAFMAAALIPIPAMRSFCFQAAILLAINLISMIFLFPAMIALDVRRIFGGKLDLACCMDGSGGDKDESTENANNNRNEGYDRRRNNDTWSSVGNTLREHSSTKDLIENGEADKQPQTPHASGLYLTRFARDYYGRILAKASMKVITLLAVTCLIGASVLGINRLEDGLDLSDMVPRNTSVWRFLEAEDEYFGFYNMHAITQGNFEYPENQAILYKYHDSFVRVANIIKDDNGGLPEFWLSLFRTWLLRLQTALDKDISAGHIDEEGWKPEASDDGILGYKLIVQTGHVDSPVDKSLLRYRRLVQDDIINPDGFYNYLSAWYSNDAMAYSYSQASIVPTPKNWFSDRSDYNLRIPKSKPIRFAQIPFLLKNLGDTETVVQTIQEIREICANFEAQGLPNFPNGIPFTFWEQYISLRGYMLLALAAGLGAIFVVISLVFMSPWAAVILTLVVGCLVSQLLGALGLLGLKLSAVPAVIIILAIGLGVEFTVHFLVGFVGSIGSREKRAILALEQMFAPVIHGAVSTLLGVVMLVFSQFDFIIRYFFLVLVALIVLGLFNGLVFFPVLLVILGPPGNLTPPVGEESVPPPTPKPSPVRFKAKPPKIHKTEPKSISSSKASKSHGRKHNSNLSLSTIAEESHSHFSNSYADSYSADSYEDEDCQRQPQLPSSTQSSLNGTSVFLEPHITVESSSGATPGVTKVTATAKFKLELHTPNGSSSFDGGNGSSGGGGSSRPSSRSRSRRSSSGSSVPSDPLRSSGDSSLASSLSSDGGFSEK